MRIIMDRNTRRSKGFAYIEMATRESIIPALSLAGQTLMGQSVMVKSSEARRCKPSACICGRASLCTQPSVPGTTIRRTLLSHLRCRVQCIDGFQRLLRCYSPQSRTTRVRCEGQVKSQGQVV